MRAARWLAETGFGEVLTTAFVRGDGSVNSLDFPTERMVLKP